MKAITRKNLLIVLTLIFFVMASNYLKTKLSFIPVYRKASYEVPLTLDPLKATATSENMLSNLLYEGLVTVNDSLRIKPQLAERWEITEEGTHYIFYLRNDALFHDGSRLLAGDVVASLKRLQDPKNKTAIENYKMISEVYSEGSSVVHIKLKSSYTSFISKLAAPAAKISKYDTANGYHLGSGAFKYQGIVSKEGKRVLLLNANNSHYGIKRMEIWELDEISAIEMAKKGFIHDTAIYTTDTRGTEKKYPIVETLAPAAVTWVFSMNTAVAPFNDINFRKCINEHFRKNDFVKKFVPEQETAKGFLPPTLSGSRIDESIDAPTQVECRNRYNNTRVTLDYPSMLRNGPEMCSFFQKDMNKIGVNVSCIPQVSFNDLLGKIKSKTSGITFLGVSLDSPDVEYFLNTFESGSDLNISNYSSSNIDGLLAQSRLEKNKAKRGEILSEINHELFRNVVTINISHPWHYSFRHKCLNNFFVGLAGDAFINYSAVSLSPFCLRREDFNNG